jgi:citrate lyase beta subunit
MTATYRSLLFVPGARPDRFDKAVAAGADTIIIDLEDAVLPGDKATARAATLDWLSARPAGAHAAVRINSPRSADGCADIAALAASHANPDFIMVPKAETSVDMEIVSEALSRRNLIAVIESGRGVSNAMGIAASSPMGVLFGGADYSASLGADLANPQAMNYVRGAISSACGAAGVPAYDVPFLDISDEDGLRATTQAAKSFGFSGRACIHPKQVDTVTAVFIPTEAELSEARAIIDALNASNGGAVLYKGKLVDRPIILAAQRILSRA